MNCRSTITVLLATVLVGCADSRHSSLEAAREALCSIKRGMTDREVKSIMGAPDEIRHTKRDVLHDYYRWVYGVSTTGHFPLVGIVLFDNLDQVDSVVCPSRPFAKHHKVDNFPQGRIPVPAPGAAIDPRPSVNVSIDNIFIDQDRNLPNASVTISNTTESPYALRPSHYGLDGITAFEVYTTNKILLFQEKRTYAPYSLDTNTPRIVLAAHEAKTEPLEFAWTVHFTDTGRLPLGTYLVRVIVKLDEEGIAFSDLTEWTVTEAWR